MHPSVLLHQPPPLPEQPKPSRSERTAGQCSVQHPVVGDEGSYCLALRALPERMWGGSGNAARTVELQQVQRVKLKSQTSWDSLPAALLAPPMTVCWTVLLPAARSVDCITSFLPPSVHHSRMCHQCAHQHRSAKFSEQVITSCRE